LGKKDLIDKPRAAMLMARGMGIRPLDEDRIRQLVEAGDHRRATARVLESYGREIFGFLMARLRDDELVSEIFSEFAEDLLRGLPRFEWRCSARAWAYTLARHAASRQLDALARRRNRDVPLSEAPELLALVQQVRTETQTHCKTEVRDHVAELRARLPEEDQTLLLLRVGRELDWREITIVLAGPEASLSEDELRRRAATLRKRFQLVKQKLKRLAREEGLLAQ
jgi:RNA polymerase sigma-70 factor, ECF subfamily